MDSLVQWHLWNKNKRLVQPNKQEKVLHADKACSRKEPPGFCRPSKLLMLLRRKKNIFLSKKSQWPQNNNIKTTWMKWISKMNNLWSNSRLKLNPWKILSSSGESRTDHNSLIVTTKTICKKQNNRKKKLCHIFTGEECLNNCWRGLPWNKD